MDHRTLDLLAGLAHELRTPLGAIAGYAELLRLGAHGPIPEAQLELLARIIRNQQTAVEILDSVLAYGTASVGALSLHPVDAPVHELLEQAVVACAALAATRNVAIRLAPADTDAGADVLIVRVDSAAAHVVLTGMLRDAVRAAKGGEVIEVTASPDGDVVSVAVAHGARTVAVADAEALFTPFARGMTQRHVSGDVEALALPYARALARAAGGDLVASWESGRLVLRLSLPRATAPVPTAG